MTIRFPEQKSFKPKNPATYSMPFKAGKNARANPAHYSRFVRLLKLVLPSLAAVLLGLILVWPQIASEKEHYTLGITKPTASDVEKMEVVNARFQSTDTSNQPYSLSAEMITETQPGSRIVQLTNPKADMLMNSGAWVATTADTGLFNQKTETLELSGPVQIFHDRGYSLETHDITFDMNESKVTGKQTVTANGPFGHIESTGFKVTDRGGIVTFTGQTKLVLFPNFKNEMP